GGAGAAAGGQRSAAARRHTTVLRSLGPGDERSFEVDLQAVADGRTPDIPITDGDVIRLPLSAVRIVPWGLWVVAREMIHIGGSVVLFCGTVHSSCGRNHDHRRIASPPRCGP